MTSAASSRAATTAGWFGVMAFGAGTAWLGGISPHVRAFQFLYGFGCAGYAILLWRVLWSKEQPPTRTWRRWLVGCVLVRALLISASPSDDVYRYVWEGRVRLEGMDPYRLPPDSAELAGLRDASWSRINHPNFPAIYPPLAQAEFTLAAAVHPAAVTVKLLHVVWDALVIVVIARCLVIIGQPPHRAVAYGLCPLVLTAFGIEGHLDSLMLLAIVAAVHAELRARPVVAGAFLGAAIATKTVAAFFVPWLLLSGLRKGGTGSAAFRGSAAVLGTLFLCYLPFGTSGLLGISNLARFATGGEFFSFPGTLGIRLFGDEVDRAVAAFVLVVVLLHLARRRADVVSYLSGATTWTLVLLPIVHAWYITWAVMFVPFTRRLAWVAVSFGMVLYFEGEAVRVSTGVWRSPPWAAVAVWCTFIASFVLDRTVLRRGARDSS